MYFLTTSGPMSLQWKAMIEPFSHMCCLISLNNEYFFHYTCSFHSSNCTEEMHNNSVVIQMFDVQRWT